MMKLSDVPGSQPDGYLVRFPFYVLAERDAHIVFTESENPDWFVDEVYEFGKFLNVFFFLNICSGHIQIRTMTFVIYGFPVCFFLLPIKSQLLSLC